MLKIKKIVLISLTLITSILLVLDIKTREENETINEEKIDAYLVSQNEKIEEDEYIGFLNIPTINLKRGFYSISSNLNNVNKNIQVIADDMDKILILAAHRGNSKVSFFQNLEKMSLGDEINLDYKHKTYHYRLYYKYYEDKDGNLAIKYDNTKNTLVLITCVRELKDKQVVYVAYNI